MNRFWLPAIVLFALTAKAQNINFQDLPHIHTALHHLTAIDLGEPIQFIAAADLESFQIERAGDKVLLQPLKESATTNLILWTASRQVAYELDAPGDVAKMNVLVRNLPASPRAAADASFAKERQEIAAAATSQAMLGAQNIVAEQPLKLSPTEVSVTVLHVLHTGEGTFLQYEIVNHSTTPFRVTTPSIARLLPSQTPISLLALRNHQISPQTLSGFKAKPDWTATTVTGESAQTDVSPGASTSGYVLVHRSAATTPEIYQLNFGSSASGALVETVVI
ncbi:hypothetical protein ACPOL_6172 [Acidisarcina polymorpha]|uniref:Uncharacterized protein n=1 Tax=Acidisarcina polymorpha TaxID=2211140 RepID=A0A2Z5GA13_9BACT|nr:hypothetical protein [Acidisarcina polymorpha]AXC15416.1 hypothetical protein ACPOL_6172 [Acidisarcina polymorpha]